MTSSWSIEWCYWCWFGYDTMIISGCISICGVLDDHVFLAGIRLASLWTHNHDNGFYLSHMWCVNVHRCNHMRISTTMIFVLVVYLVSPRVNASGAMARSVISTCILLISCNRGTYQVSGALFISYMSNLRGAFYFSGAENCTSKKNRSNYYINTRVGINAL